LIIVTDFGLDGRGLILSRRNFSFCHYLLSTTSACRVSCSMHIRG